MSGNMIVRILATLALLLVLAGVAIQIPLVPGAHRLSGLYSGSPFSGWKATALTHGAYRLQGRGGNFILGRDQAEVLLHLATQKSQLTKSGSPYFGYLGTEEAEEYVIRPWGRLLYLPSYGMWIGTHDSSWQGAYSLANSVSFFGPSVCLYLYMLSGLLGLMAWRIRRLSTEVPRQRPGESV